jgi:hypothetical protein
VADLLLKAPVAQAAAEAVWRMEDPGVRTVLTVILSNGVVASGYTPAQGSRALDLLRSTCPRHRREFLDAETRDDPEQIARRLVELVRTESRRYRTLTHEQKAVVHDRHRLDELTRSGAQVDEWIAGRVEVRTIGYRLNAEGGFARMQWVCDRVGELSGSGQTRRELEMWWSHIGRWLG